MNMRYNKMMFKSHQDVVILGLKFMIRCGMRKFCRKNQNDNFHLKIYTIIHILCVCICMNEYDIITEREE